MTTKKASRTFCAALTLAALTFSLAVRAQAQTLKVLHSFTGKLDGGNPDSPLLFDSAGNLYGATVFGGNRSFCPTYGCGVVYELSPTTTGPWLETPIYSFLNSNTGGFPGGSLVRDASGNLFGEATSGDNAPYCGNLSLNGCGLVFEVTASGQESILQPFDKGADGALPGGGLTADTAGNLYGTTLYGGNNRGCEGSSCGVVFQLSPTSSGGWQETVLYEFIGGSDGAYPGSAVTLDAAGNIYGTTSAGGNLVCAQNSSGCGVVFELSPTSSGTWQESVLHTFSGAVDGATPESAPVIDSAGNLYGTAVRGGLVTDCGGGGCGVAYKISLTSTGWKETVLHLFTGGTDGSNPSGLVLGPAGVIYGTALQGGNVSDCASIGGCGVIFRLSSNSSGTWKETVLHTFTGGPDGAQPLGPLTLDARGFLYGVTKAGGAGYVCTLFGLTGCGVAFKITP